MQNAASVNGMQDGWTVADSWTLRRETYSVKGLKGGCCCFHPCRYVCAAGCVLSSPPSGTASRDGYRTDPDSSCILRVGAPRDGGWTDEWLQGHGPFVRERMRE